ncbi:DNA polymerase III subunit gamma/tau [Alkalilimnicola ehrlichii MLHE-1]|uniref:DNA polymerase III subunit gamma/tau n=1 Tax=Alkalilimnicola ehrlichii (strain ATCC BAA-1101 / DSM 17681 / MLHE-1) TaxID=187272 RepID=Q0A8H8_ALKEH|nr:DNA polymerase III subunit gamma/tau [Alkalilimnicola ehrlichii]ABI56859.1 DNA polymerase III, gamma subunit [Alkalilimnicola ehrlichii MLHE-1]
MAYQVLARKWRPRTFSEMAGQEHVLRALVNALEQQRLHHAYLFTGTRGVGKTTVARILAKCLNCEQGVTAEPCGTCDACRELDAGRFVDLIEVDAASRTKVEDTRELLDNVQYAPTRGRYKIYLIDEVHMLSGHSFNALLKTLEEPPPHVKFLLATTDPQKLPVTILSRCLQFNLKNLPGGLVADYLHTVVEQEGVAAEPQALARLGQAAKGSMRDALSLLDQAIAFGAGAVREDEVCAMLGTIDRGFVLEALEALAAGDGRALLAVTARMSERAPDFSDALDELLHCLHQLALLQVVPEALPAGDPDADRLRDLAARLPAEDVQLYYQIALNGRRDLPLAPEGRTGFEMVLLRMLAFQPVTGTAVAATGGAGADAPPAAAAGSPRSQAAPKATRPRREAHPSPTPTERAEPAAAPAGGSPPPEQGGGLGGYREALMRAARGQAVEPDGPAPAPADPSAAAEPAPAGGREPAAGLTDPPAWAEGPPVSDEEPPPIGAQPAAAETAPETTAPDDAGITPETWPWRARDLPLDGALRQFAAHCEWVGEEEGRVILRLDSGHGMLRTPALEAELAQVLGDYLGRAVRLDVRLESPHRDTPATVARRERAERLRAARESLENDPNVARLHQRFGAELLPDTVRPRKGADPAT